MKFHLPILLTAAGVIALAAVAASDYGNTLFSPGKIKASKTIEISLPDSPDSISAKVNPLKKEDILDGLSPLSKSNLQNLTADYTTLLPDTAGRYIIHPTVSDGNAAIDRYFTIIGADRFFKGKLRVTTPVAAKAFVNGKETAAKSSFDSVPGTCDGPLTLQPGKYAIIEVRTLSIPGVKDCPLKIEIEPDNDFKSVNLYADPDMKSRYDILSTVTGTRLHDAKLSPDGKYVLLEMSSNTDGINTTEEYSLIETASGNVVATDIAAGCEWLQQRNSTLYYKSDEADGSFSIRTIDVPSMRHGILANGLPAKTADFILSPTEDYIIFYNTVKGDADEGVMRRVQSPDDRQPRNRDRNYLSIYRFNEMISRPITYGGPSTYIQDISSDGKRILYTSTREMPDSFPFYETRLIDLNLESLRGDTIPGTDSSLTEAIFSPDSRRILVLAGPNAFGGIGLNAGTFKWGNDFDIQAYIYDSSSKKVTPLTRDFNPSIMNGAVWNRGDNKIYFRAQKGFDAFVFCLDPNKGDINQVSDKIDFVRSFSVASAKADWLAYTGMSYNYMGRGYIRNLRNGKTRLLADPMATALSDMDLGKSEMWSFKSADGTEIEGTLTLPPNFDPSKKYPLIVYYYGGTTPSTHTNHSPYSPTLFASYGYVVYTVNPSGTIGYGQEFSARHVNAWGERTADEIIRGTELLCDSHSFIDRKKIGCIGASYGGFMTQLLQTKTDIFAAAVSHAGISNITSYWGEGYWGYSYNAVAAARSYPWNNSRLFIENSPLFHADKIHTPLLLLHGSVDTNVPIGESIQLYNALKILGRDVEFVTVDGENHIIMDFQKRTQWHATIMAWFEKWLKNDPAWWNSIYKN